MQEKVIEAIVALAGVRWMQAEEIQLVVLPRGAMVPDGGYIPDWHAWNAQIRLGGGKWGELVGEGKTPEEAVESLLKSLVTAHKAVDERRERVLEFVPWDKRKYTTREETNRRTRDRTLQQAIQLVAQAKTFEEAEDILHKMLTGAIPAPKAPTTEDDPGQQFNAKAKRVSLDGKAVGTIAGGFVDSERTLDSLKKELGDVIGNTTPHASRGTSDAYQRLGARLVSRIPESLRRMTYERPNDAWQTESPRSLLKRISEETDHVLSCMLSGQYAEDVWSQLADIAAAAFIVGDSYEAKRWAPTSTDGSGL